MIEFDELENDDTIFVAIQEYLELLKLDGNDGLATVPMSVFQMWYIAKRAPELLLPSEIVNEAQSHFPDLAEYPRFHQLSLGATALARERGDRLR